MTLLIIQEQHFTQMKNGQVWVNESSNVEYWDRYLDVFDHLLICARIKKSSNNDTYKLMRSDRPEIEFISLPDFWGINGIIKNYFIITQIIKKAIKKADCIIYRAPSPISLIAYRLVLHSQKPFAVELMNNPQTTYSSKSSKGVLMPLIRKYITHQTKEMCKKANGVSYVTEYTLQKLYPCHAILTNKNPHNYFYSNYSTIRLNKDDYQFPIDKNSKFPPKLVFVNSGKMNDYRKGHDIMIRIMKFLSDKGYNVELHLIGDGRLKVNFEAYARQLGVSDRVIFEGWITGYESVQKVLKKGDIFLFPSYGEGLPRAVLEAMANGLIPIASDIDGICEIVPEEFLVIGTNELAFCKKIEELIRNWGQIDYYRKKVFNISKKYEYSILREKRKSFYQKLYNIVKK